MRQKGPVAGCGLLQYSPLPYIDGSLVNMNYHFACII